MEFLLLVGWYYSGCWWLHDKAFKTPVIDPDQFNPLLPVVGNVTAATLLGIFDLQRKVAPPATGIPAWVETLDPYWLRKTNIIPSTGLQCLVDEVLKDVVADPEALTAIIAQLHDAWEQRRLLSPTFNQKAYRKRKKVGRKFVKIDRRNQVEWWEFCKVRNAFQQLEDHGYTNYIKGYIDIKSGEKVPGRVWPSFSLMCFFNDYNVGFKTKTSELIYLMDGVKKKRTMINFEDTPYIKGRRLFLQAYNLHLAGWEILYNGKVLNSELFSVFSRGRFDAHGRFYVQGGWQGLDEAKRSKIVFRKDGVEFSADEYDFTSIHPNLAASISGVELPNVNGDLYLPVLEELGLPVEARGASKGMMFNLINAETRLAAIRASKDKVRLARNNYTENTKRRRTMTKNRIRTLKMADLLDEYNVTPEDLADAVAKVHHKIGNWFGSNAGVFLMWHDAEIMRKAMERCMALEIPALPMHDSLVYPVQFKEVVSAIMEEELALHVEGINSGHIVLQPELKALIRV